MSSDIAYWLSIGLLAAGGAVVVYAVLFDWIVHRVRRRRRCPKCWYDLSHTPGRTCSECGYLASRERELFKARRRWAVASLGALLLLGSYAARITPDVQTRGWPAAVPTTAKILLFPVLAPDRDEVVPFFRGRLHQWTANEVSDLRWQDRLYLDLLRYVSIRTNTREKRFRRWHRWAIEAVVDERAREHPEAEFIWNNHTGLLLAATHWRDGTSIDWDVYAPGPRPDVRIRTRSQWPRGVPLGAITGSCV